MKYGQAVLKKIGQPIKTSDELLEMLELPCISQQFETFQAISFPKEGIEFAIAQNGTLISVHLFSEELDGKKQYHRELPFNIKFGDQQEDIAKKLEQPLETRGGGNNWRGKEIPQWNRYCVDGVVVHFQYSRIDGGLEIITMMAQDSMP